MPDHIKSWDELMIENDALDAEALYEAIAQAKREIIREKQVRPISPRLTQALNTLQSGLLFVVPDEPEGDPT